MRAGLGGAPEEVDLVVVGLGITGAGVALDAVTRGLTVLAVDAHDLAFGTSRWSSKLVHGGIRYLGKGQVGVAYESAVERGVLMETTAPHLTHAVPTLIPFGAEVAHASAVATGAALWAGDVLRRVARTSGDLLPPPRRTSALEALALAPGLRREGLRGAILGWDGQLEDDARLVITVARTAASYGAHVRTRARAIRATGTEVVLRDELTGTVRTVRARAVVNATGVWAGDLAPEVRLRPSRGTHLVLREETLPGLRTMVFAPIPGTFGRFVLVLPQPDGTIYVGLTDEPAEGPVPDVPQPSEPEVDFLLEVVRSCFERSIGRGDVVGAYAGLRPLLDVAHPDHRHGDHPGAGRTADLSRRHAVLTSRTGVVTVVGGKLTTYRRMAQDAVDAAVAAGRLDAGPCCTRRLPLLGAADRDTLRRLVTADRPDRLVRRYGTEADLVLETARTVTGLATDELLRPVATGVPTCLAELVFGVTHEGAHDVGDLLDRRARVGLVPADRALAVPAAERALARGAARGPMSPALDPRSVGAGRLHGGEERAMTQTDTTDAETSQADQADQADQAAGTELDDFPRLTERYQRELLAHCYRMSGSVHEAEDLVQETFLRAWKASAGFQGRSSVRTWLYRIATNVCLTNLENKPRRPLPAGLGTPDQMAGDALEENHEVAWLEPVPDAAVLVGERDSIRLAFVAALQHLPARQRAVLILRDVLRWSAAEVAEALETTVAAVNSALQRAHAQMTEQVTERGLTQDTVTSDLDPAQRELLDRYVDAFWRKDIDQIVGLLKAEAIWEMPPFTGWYLGNETIGELIATQCPGGHHDMPMLETRANGQPAFGLYMRGPAGDFTPFHLQVLDIDGHGADQRVAHVGAFFDTDLFARFGLPARLPADHHPGDPW